MSNNINHITTSSEPTPLVPGHSPQGPLQATSTKAEKADDLSSSAADGDIGGFITADNDHDMEEEDQRKETGGADSSVAPKEERVIGRKSGRDDSTEISASTLKTQLEKLGKVIEDSEAQKAFALRDVAEERQRVRCLKAVISKGRNLNADEYAEILGTTDPNTAGYIRKVTTIDPSNDKDAELKLDNAERRLDNAERRLDNAERRLKEAKQELDNAELKVKEAEAKRYRIENTPFEWDATLAQKKRLAQGPGARLLGSLKGRSKGLSEIKEGYKILARQRGSVASKKNVPIIACAAISGAGKTEMLTHVVNSHGHHADGDNSEADEILNIINGESPEHATPLTKLVTFFCSFNSLSPYKDTEDPVIELTTVERMIRTYSGNRDFEYSKKMSIDITFKTLIDRIPDDVGVIMCLDEVGLLSDKARRVLLLAAMSCCETLIDRGRFAAIVATSLYFWVWNKSVYSGSNRTIHPFTLQALPSDESLLIGIRDVLIEKYLKTPTSPEDNFTVNVIARLLSQECKPQQWVNYFTTNRTLVHPTPTAIAPNDDLDESTVFEWIAPAIIGKPHVTILFAEKKELVKGLQSRYGEYVITSGTEADTLRGEMRLPAVRFLQLSWEQNKYVGIWTQRALAECMGAQSVVELRKRWELGVIALLEVWRCAMRAVDPSATFRLKDLPIFRNWDAPLNKDGSLNKECKCVVRLTDLPLMDEFLPNTPLPLVEKEGIFGVWHSSDDNAPAIEGTIFFSKNLRLAYQMKLVESAVIASTLRRWCEGIQKYDKTHPDTNRIYLLFVTNVSTENLRLMIDEIPDSLPRNLIVVSESAVRDLVQPFGAGTLASFLQDKEMRSFRKARVHDC